MQRDGLTAVRRGYKYADGERLAGASRIRHMRAEMAAAPLRRRALAAQ